MSTHAIRQWSVAAFAATVSLAAQPSLGARQAGVDREVASPAWSRVYIKDGYARDAARRALSDALERLAQPACQSLFWHFHDTNGRPLAEKLRDLGESPQGYLQLIIFEDGSDRPGCRRPAILAFTAPGSRIVSLCGRDFERAWRRDRHEAEVTIIHEMLHSLGLGENPPTPRFISHRVKQLCWR